MHGSARRRRSPSARQCGPLGAHGAQKMASQRPSSSLLAIPLTPAMALKISHSVVGRGEGGPILALLCPLLHETSHSTTRSGQTSREGASAARAWHKPRPVLQLWHRRRFRRGSLPVSLLSVGALIALLDVSLVAPLLAAERSASPTSPRRANPLTVVTRADSAAQQRHDTTAASKRTNPAPHRNRRQRLRASPRRGIPPGPLWQRERVCGKDGLQQ